MRIPRTEIMDFIKSEVERHPSDLVSHVAKTFGITRQTASQYVRRQVTAGTLHKFGETKNTRYYLVGGTQLSFATPITSTLQDDYVWRKYVRPMLALYPSNIIEICSFGFTEMFNNAIDHSEGSEIYTRVEIRDNVVYVTLMDNGVGIFKKIQKALRLDSERESILHLAKGKFTTDPTKHTGEGIFFTSRMFTSFAILSGDLYYTFTNRDWMLSKEKQEQFGNGTSIQMSLDLTTTTVPRDVFRKFEDDDYGFTKTVIAVALSADPGDPHVSRSQAKRLLMGLEKFKHVVLDFKGVQSVGQAFVDEIFRVFKTEHPEVTFQWFNASQEVEEMIRRGTSGLQ